MASALAIPILRFQNWDSKTDWLLQFAIFVLSKGPLRKAIAKNLRFQLWTTISIGRPPRLWSSESAESPDFSHRLHAAKASRLSIDWANLPTFMVIAFYLDNHWLSEELVFDRRVELHWDLATLSWLDKPDRHLLAKANLLDGPLNHQTLPVPI